MTSLRLKAAVLAIAILLGAAVIGGWLSLAGWMDQSKAADVALSNRMETCIAELARDGTLESSAPNADYAFLIKIRYSIAAACANEAAFFARINEYTIRSNGFRDYAKAYRISTYLLTAIVVIGLALSSLQFYISGKIAAPNQAAQDEITLKNNELSVKSSYIGITILGISLVFFIVFASLVSI